MDASDERPLSNLQRLLLASTIVGSADRYGDISTHDENIADPINEPDNCSQSKTSKSLLSESEVPEWSDFSSSSSSSLMSTQSMLTPHSALSRSTPFPLRLFTLISAEAGQGVLDWLPNGRGFVIYDEATFLSEVLPEYKFKASKITSIQRNLNIYGFQRLVRGEFAGAYVHPLFRKGMDPGTVCERVVRRAIGSELPVHSKEFLREFATQIAGAVGAAVAAAAPAPPAAAGALGGGSGGVIHDRRQLVGGASGDGGHCVGNCKGGSSGVGGGQRAGEPRSSSSGGAGAFAAFLLDGATKRAWSTGSTSKARATRASSSGSDSSGDCVSPFGEVPPPPVQQQHHQQQHQQHRQTPQVSGHQSFGTHGINGRGEGGMERDSNGDVGPSQLEQRRTSPASVAAVPAGAMSLLRLSSAVVSLTEAEIHGDSAVFEEKSRGGPAASSSSSSSSADSFFPTSPSSLSSPFSPTFYASLKRSAPSDSDSFGDEESAAGYANNNKLPRLHRSSPFPERLFVMVSETAETQPCTLQWLSNGAGFVIHDEAAFLSEVLPKYKFKASKITSIQRNLNIYGFQRLVRGEFAGAYVHPLFQKGMDPRTLASIVRRDSVVSSGSSSSSSMPRSSSSNSTFVASGRFLASTATPLLERRTEKRKCRSAPARRAAPMAALDIAAADQSQGWHDSYSVDNSSVNLLATAAAKLRRAESGLLPI